MWRHGVKVLTWSCLLAQWGAKVIVRLSWVCVLWDFSWETWSKCLFTPDRDPRKVVTPPILSVEKQWVDWCYLQKHGQLTGNCITEKPTAALVMTQESCIPRAPCRPVSLFQESWLARGLLLALDAVICFHNLGEEPMNLFSFYSRLCEICLCPGSPSLPSSWENVSFQWRRLLHNLTPLLI